MASFTSIMNYSINIGKSSKEISKAQEKYEEFKPSKSDTPEEANKKQEELRQNVKNKVAGTVGASIGTALAVAGFVYNTYNKFTRFGQRGQDIADQNRLQDKMVNMGLGVAGSLTGLGISLATGNIFGAVASVVGLVGMGVSEAINVSQQNAQYEYNKMIDQEQKAISQERIGRPNYSSSRR